MIFIRFWWRFAWRRWCNLRCIGRGNWRFFFTVGRIIIRIFIGSEFFEHFIVTKGKVFRSSIQSFNLLEMLVFFGLNKIFNFRCTSGWTSGQNSPSKTRSKHFHHRKPLNWISQVPLVLEDQQVVLASRRWGSVLAILASRPLLPKLWSFVYQWID